MPLYLYKVASTGETIELFHSMKEAPLKVHPETGEKLTRVYTSHNVRQGLKSRLSDKNLAEKGFTKYKKEGNGRYVKVAGTGPNTITN